MPGPDNVVPDFLSRPWVDEQGQDRTAIHTLHLLSTAPPVRHTSLHSLQQDPCSLVVVLPTWKGSVAVQQRGGACGLWAVACQKGDTPLQTVKRLQSALTRDPTAEPIVTSRTWHSRGLWRFGGWTFRRKQSSGKHRRVLSSNGCCR